MKTGTAIVLATGAGLLLTGIAFKNGIDRLQYSLYDIGLRGAQPVIVIAVQNNSCFSYPVPRMFLNIFNEAGTFLGSLSSVEMQWINKKGVSLLTAVLLPNYFSLGEFLSTIILTRVLPQGFNVNGIFTIADVPIHIDSEIQTNISPFQLLPNGH